MIRPILIAFAASVSCTVLQLPVAAAEFPRASVPEVENGTPGPFVGSWSMGYPALEETDFVSQLATCDKPVAIERLSDTRIAYTSQDDEHSEFELDTFEGRTVWWPDDAPNLIAVWTSADSFLIYTVGPTGSADWANPYEFKRCV